jgi:polyhydroxyalkanoate synthesis regulator phasin
MSDAKGRKEAGGGRLRGLWRAMVRIAEVMDRSPFDEAFERLDRLEREVATLKRQHFPRSDDRRPQK